MKAVWILVVLLAGCASPTTDAPGPAIEPENCNGNFEQAFDGYSIIMDSYTPETNTSVSASFRWTLRGPDEGAKGVINFTNLVWGFNPVALCNVHVGYIYHEEGINGTLDVPRLHETQIIVRTPGVYYARGHFEVDGVNVYTPEVEFVVRD